jgi:hypothetical protein
MWALWWWCKWNKRFCICGHFLILGDLCESLRGREARDEFDQVKQKGKMVRGISPMCGGSMRVFFFFSFNERGCSGETNPPGRLVIYF